MTTKRSFFYKLAGNSDDVDPFDDELPAKPAAVKSIRLTKNEPERETLPADPFDQDAPGSGAGQLPVDVRQNANEIVIRAFVAGVRPDELNISISRDMVEIEGSRMERDETSNGDYFTRELFWGSFSRTILLPSEVDVENSSAAAKDGLLTIILPKLDKAKQTKLRVKAG